MQEDFVKTLPGMERRINEHIVSFHFPSVPAAAGSDFPGSAGGSLAQSNQPAEMSDIRHGCQMVIAKFLDDRCLAL